MDSLDYIFGLAALAYIVTSTMFAAVRWWHTCPTADKGYANPDRRMQALLYLVPAVVLAPCVLWPARPSAQALAAHYFVLCHSFFCALLLMTYFGQVKGWQRWKPWSVFMVLLSMFNVWFLILVLPAHRHREDPVAEVPRDAPVYNLNGQRLSSPQKGINVVEGQKVVVN